MIIFDAFVGTGLLYRIEHGLEFAYDAHVIEHRSEAVVPVFRRFFFNIRLVLIDRYVLEAECCACADDLRVDDE